MSYKNTTQFGTAGNRYEYEEFNHAGTGEAPGNLRWNLHQPRPAGQRYQRHDG